MVGVGEGERIKTNRVQWKLDGRTQFRRSSPNLQGRAEFVPAGGL